MKRGYRALLAAVADIMLIIALCACSPTTVPEPSFTPAAALATGSPEPVVTSAVPAYTAGPDTSVIMAPQYEYAEDFTKVVARINRILADKSAGVAFAVKESTYFGDGMDGYITFLNQALASGSSEADGYLIYAGNGGELEAAALMDVKALIQSAAPVYYAKHQSLCDHNDTGIPVGVGSDACRYQPALMLREDAELEFKPGVSMFEQLLSFIEAFTAEGKPWTILAEPPMLVRLWAMDLGYYPIAVGGSNLLCYAKVDDAACKPVLLEQLPGFYALIDTLMPLYTRTNELAFERDIDESREVIGFVTSLGSLMQPDYYNDFSWFGGEFTAHEFHPDGPVFLPPETQYNNGEIVLPKTSGKAEQIVKFVEWFYSSQENYNIAVYGEADVDYTVKDGHMLLLYDGKPVQFLISYRNYGLWRAGSHMLACTEYTLPPQSAPENLESLISGGSSGKPLLPFEALRAEASQDEQKLLELSGELTDLLDKRRDYMNRIVIYSMQESEYWAAQMALERLDNKRILDEITAAVEKFRQAVAKLEGQ